jgi:chloride channel protein, CIC family
MAFRGFASIFDRVRNSLSLTAQFYASCVFVGACGALAAILLKNSVGYLEQGLRDAALARNMNLLILTLPPIGIVLTALFTKKIVKTDLSHGVTKVLAAISMNGGVVPRKMIWAPLVGCTITVGFGGSVGMEAPIMHSGSAIGSAVGQALGLDYRRRVLMVGCGTAAAVAAIFKAPIAGALFAIEILMIDLTNQSIIPLLISSVTGAMLAKVFTGEDIEFTFAVFNPFDYRNTFFYIVLGLICGLVAEYIKRVQRKIGGIAKLVSNPYLRAAVGGLALVPLILFFPPLFGEGYSGMRSMLSGHADELLANSPFYSLVTQGWPFVAYLVVFIFVKGIATAATGAAGGVGGVFAPSLFMGSAVGYCLARSLRLLGIGFASELNFALVGMAGVLSALLKAPLTAIFLIAEITGGYALLVPLILTSGVAYMIARLFGPYSIYAEDLANRRELLTHQKDQAALTIMETDALIDRRYPTVKPEMPVSELKRIALGTHRPAVAVVDDYQQLLGIVRFDEIRSILFDCAQYGTDSVSDIAQPAGEVIIPGASMVEVLQCFERTGAAELPCITAEGRFIGFIGRVPALEAYRKAVLALTGDE